jgi:hypothetical protein
MATVNYSVPEEVKDAFNRAFAGRNKSAIITELMRGAVEDAQIRERRSRAIGELLTMRGQGPSVSDQQIRNIRDEEHS